MKQLPNCEDIANSLTNALPCANSDCGLYEYHSKEDIKNAIKEACCQVLDYVAENVELKHPYKDNAWMIDKESILKIKDQLL